MGGRAETALASAASIVSADPEVAAAMSTGWKRWRSSWLAVLVLAACGGAGTVGGVGDTLETGDAGPDADAAPDTGPDADTAPDVAVPVACDPGTACSALLLEDGACPATCVPQPAAPTCLGTVHNALCYAQPPGGGVNEPAQIGDVLLVPVEVPDLVTAGEDFTVLIEATNTGSAAVAPSFGYKLPNTWEVVDAEFTSWTTLPLAAGETRAITATMRALAPNIFGWPPVLVTFIVDDRGWEFYATSGVPPGDGVTCGGVVFPASLPVCPDCSPYHQYGQARCCDGVFYPGDDCCGDGDCGTGACVDGRCVSGVPAFGPANGLLHGSVSVLLVLADTPDVAGLDPCDDALDALGAGLRLDEVDALLRGFVVNRTAEDRVRFRWRIAAGVSSDDFWVGPGYELEAWAAALEAHLDGLGCLPPIEDFDKIIMASPRLDLGTFEGLARANGRIGVKSTGNHVLLAHELAHTFGAMDVYTDLGGAYQLKTSLMGNNNGAFGPIDDQVMWGELGLGDVDRSGVIDLVEHAAYPDALVPWGVTARYVGTKNTLEVEATVRATEGGQVKKVLLGGWVLALPDFGVEREVLFDGVTVFDATEIDMEALLAAETVSVRVVATHTFTDAAFVRQTLVLDETVAVPLTKTTP